MSERGNRRLGVAGVLAGLTIGAAVGLSVLTGAAPEVITGVRPVVLHVARVLADPGTDLELTAGLVCPGAEAEACRSARASVHVLPAAGGAWTEVDGALDAPGWRFLVPGRLIPEAGFSYWLELAVEGGPTVRLPSAGAGAPFRVVTTAGLRQVRWPAGSVWADLAHPDGVVARLRYGDGEGEVGRIGGTGDLQALGPSSFDVAPDGSIHVADWVHRRILVLSPRGSVRRAVPLPVERPVDLAVASNGEYALTTLGLRATAFEVRPDGKVVGRYDVLTGVAERVAATQAGPQVWVGPAQWAPVRSVPGVQLAAEAQAGALAQAAPGRDGAVALSQDLGGGRIAFVWARPDGSRAGAVLELPAGVEPGLDHLVRGLPDGGAIAAHGLWADGHQGVAILRFAADGSLATASLVEPPTGEMDAAASTVRFRDPNEVLVFRSGTDDVRIDRYEVTT
ncbi:MAG TPA: hypothetical protein VFQ40_01070 [Actinomycetota bacterium]|nr:hypothetical protein [Actinomycetota bacterium]